MRPKGFQSKPRGSSNYEIIGSGQTKALPCRAYANLVRASILKYSSTRLGKQLLANSGWEEKEICSKGVSDGQKEGQRGDGAFPRPLLLPSTLTLSQTWPVE